MNNLLLTKKRIKKSEKLHKAQLGVTHNGILISYRLPGFIERQKVASNEAAAMD